MGAWGPGIFENDDALDWLFSLDDSTDLKVVETTLAEVLAAEVVEIGLSCAGLAAAALVAAMHGNNTETLPENAAQYVVRTSALATSEIRKQALAAVERIRENSELRLLWKE